MHFRIVIVDDEKEVRGRLVELIKQTTMPLEIVGEYDNGADAYEGIISVVPDIIITDIKIPYMDGLEVIRRVSKVLPLIKSIVITGFDEFDYAKQAANLNVVGFISKPITLKELKDVLSKTASVIDDEFLLSNNISKLESFYNNNYNAIRENTLCKLLTTNIILPIFESRLSYDKIDVNFTYMAIAVFDFDKSVSDVDAAAYEHAIFSVKNDINELNGKPYFIDAFFRTDYVVALIKSNERINFSLLNDYFTVILAKIKKVTKLSISVGISRVYEKPFNCKQMFEQARRSLEGRSVIGGEKVFNYGEAIDVRSQSNERNIDESDYKQLANSLKMLDEGEATSKLQLIKDIVSKQSNLQVYYYVLNNTLSAIIRGCTRQEQFFTNLEGYNSLNIKLMETKTADEAFDYLSEVAKKVLEVNNASIGEDIKGTYKVIVDYLNNNYTDSELSMETLSASINLSISYICSILKNQNTSFVKYLTTLRIEHAKRLLEIPENKIVGIANDVGYRDPYYFSHCFKKHTGVSPKEYRESNI